MKLNKWEHILPEEHVKKVCGILNITENEIEDIYLNPGRSLNNFNCVIVVGGRSYLYRIPGEGTELFANRAREALSYSLLKPFKITDEVIYIDPETGIKLSVFYVGSHIPDMNNKDDLRRSMRQLYKFHNLDVKFPHDDPLFGRMERYKKFVDDIGGDIYFTPEYYDMLEKMREFKAKLEKFGTELRPIHGDCSINNTLIAKEFDHPIFVDMEFAAMGDPFDDIAIFCHDADMNVEQTLEILDFYLDRKATKQEQFKLIGSCAVVSVMWYSWAVYKMFVEKDECEKYKEYRDLYYDFAKVMYEGACEIEKEMNAQI